MFPVIRAVCVSAIVAIVAIAGCPAAAADQGDATLFRIFLRNGTALTSYGEYARVDDRVVFSMPIAFGGAGGPTLQLVDLPESAIDWAATERYADAARYTHYVATRGDLDYAALNNHIAQVLAQIGAAADPARRLELALGARRTLLEWPKAHYGYRANDIVQISGLLDEAIAELRAETGGTAFDLSFVATIGPPETAPLLPPATERDLVEQALAVAGLTDRPSERTSLLESIAAALEGPASSTKPGEIDDWRIALHAIAATELGTERRVDAAYDLMSTELRRSAAQSARRADVAGVERVLGQLNRRDRWLGRRRPDRIQGLVASLYAELDAAQRLRLARDHWELRLPSLQKYQRAATDLLERFEAARPRLDDIRRLVGLSDIRLARLSHTMGTVAHSMRALTPPDEVATAHALVLSALDLAATAASVRRDAVRSGNIETARDAASAAAGALMLMGRARADIDSQLRPPQIR